MQNKRLLLVGVHPVALMGCVTHRCSSPEPTSLFAARGSQPYPALFPSSQVLDQMLLSSQRWAARPAVRHLSVCCESREVSSQEQAGFSQSRYLQRGLSTRSSQVSTQDGRRADVSDIRNVLRAQLLPRFKGR